MKNILRKLRFGGSVLLSLTTSLTPLFAVTITNPGFESNFSGWTDIDPSSISTSDVHSGSRSAKIEGSAGRVEQSVSVDTNTDYVLRAWVLGKGKIGVIAGSNDYNESGDFGSFTEVEVDFNSGSQTSVTIYAAYNGGTGRFDDFTLEEDTSGGGGGGGSEELLGVDSVDASSNDGNVPGNTLDNNLSTRWSAQGDGEWIRYELEEEATITSIDIAWHQGNTRTSDFLVQVSSNGTSWTTVLSQTSSSGTTLDLETYDLTDTVGSWVRIVGYGNSYNNWNSITEVDIYGIPGGGSGGGSAYQYFEAEEEVTTGWQVNTDSSASDGEYLIATSQSTGSAPGDGTLSFPFSLSEALSIEVWVLVQTPSTSDDSIWIRVPSSSSTWTNWGSGWNTSATNWYWRKWNTLSLGSGNHSLEIKYRENGFMVDRVLITSDTEFVPEDPESGGGGGEGWFGLDPEAPPGDNFDLSTWKITFPDASEENEIWVAGGGESANEFFTDPVTGGMVFRCPNIAGSTGGSSYSRTELREMLRAGNTSISTQGINGNNWVFSTSSTSNQNAAGGVDGTLEATLTVDHVSTTGESGKVGRVIVGQIHASGDEPCRLYYRKLPGNSKGSIYFAHEPTSGSEQWYEMIGSRSNSASNPSDGIELGELWSYVIDVSGNTLTVTIKRDGKSDVVETVDMSSSGFANDWMYFKAGLYNQNNSGDSGDYAQATFYELVNSHD